MGQCLWNYKGAGRSSLAGQSRGLRLSPCQAWIFPLMASQRDPVTPSLEVLPGNTLHPPHPVLPEIGDSDLLTALAFVFSRIPSPTFPARSACPSLAHRYPCSPSMSAPWGKGFLPPSFPAPFQVPRTVPGAETLRANTCPRKLLEVGRPPPATPAPDKQRGSRRQLWKMTCFYCYVCSGF